MTTITPPLVVDLDGTLLNSDLLFETGMTFLRNQPLRLFKPFIWLTRGKAALKEGLALANNIDVSVLPYDPQVIELIKTERSLGRRIVLATASHYSLAKKIAEHLNLFDQVLATSSSQNLSGKQKRDLLIQHYGEQGFDYAGNSHDDIPVWEAARYAYVVNPDKGVEHRAAAHGNVQQVIRSKSSSLKDWTKALRLHQWMKNALIFAPLLAAHQLTNLTLLWQGVLAFVLFGLCASSVYLLNDLLDLTDDRHHHSKRHRPFASGRLTISSGLKVFPLLIISAFSGALLLLPWQFAAVMATYYLLTLGYSLSLKRYMAIDVIALALLYTIRIIAGAAAMELVMTFWMLAFSMFIFLSLALVKRYAELWDARRKGLTEKTRGRGYYPADLEMISSLGASSGYIAVMVLALYIHEQATIGLYSHPQIIWLACPLLLFWTTRIWMLTHRGQMHDDPVVFAIKDKVSVLVGILFGLVFWVAA
ncbi:UbiA family prenyltransferase [Pseudomonas protegens]|uniref:UbiA family prenyltransferase n=1 Tax=Pseudomonas protegens TaxID=380021 RepID=UPI003569A3C1